MENSLNRVKTDKKIVNKALKEKKQLNDVYGPLGLTEIKQDINKPFNIMARRYELAYIKLHDELPSWKKRSFNKNNKNVNDTLYNEFIATVIAFAENEQNNV
jgi:hypothetical protein